MSQLKIPCETKMMKNFYKQIAMLGQQSQKKTQYLEAINLLDENSYVLKRIEIEYQASTGLNVDSYMESLFSQYYPHDCRIVRYYNSWIESEFIAQPIDHSEPKKQNSKPQSILSFINNKDKDKDKKKQKNNLQNLKLNNKESKKEKMFLYMQFERFQFVRIPDEEARFNFICVIYYLYCRILKSGQVPDLSLSKIIRDRDKRIKFLSRVSSFQKEAVASFVLHVLTEKQNLQEARKMINHGNYFNEQTRLKFLDSKSNQQLSSLIIEVLQDKLRTRISVQVLFNTAKHESKQICILQNHFVIYSNNQEEIRIDLSECIIEYKKESKTAQITLYHDILEPVNIKINRYTFHDRLFKELRKIE